MQNVNLILKGIRADEMSFKLNGVRLASNQPAPFKPDDLIEISRYIFTVKEQEL